MLQFDTLYNMLHFRAFLRPFQALRVEVGQEIARNETSMLMLLLKTRPSLIYFYGAWQAMAA